MKKLCPGVRIDLSGAEHALCSTRCIELLESYKSECKPYLEQKNKSMDFNKLHDYIHGSLEQKIYAISMLENMNLRMS